MPLSINSPPSLVDDHFGRSVVLENSSAAQDTNIYGWAGWMNINDPNEARGERGEAVVFLVPSKWLKCFFRTKCFFILKMDHHDHPKNRIEGTEKKLERRFQVVGFHSLPLPPLDFILLGKTTLVANNRFALFFANPFRKLEIWLFPSTLTLTQRIRA